MRKSIAPRYHAKGRILDALAVTLLLALMGAIGALTLLAFSPAAKADDRQYITDRAVSYTAAFGYAVCATLDTTSSAAGFVGIMNAIEDDGLTDKEAGGVVVLAVSELCPRHQPALDRFVYGYAVPA